MCKEFSGLESALEDSGETSSSVKDASGVVQFPVTDASDDTLDIGDTEDRSGEHKGDEMRESSESSLHVAVSEADDLSVVELLSPNNQIYTKRNIRIIAVNLAFIIM